MEELQGDGFRLADYLSENIGNDGLEDFYNNGDGYGQVAYNGHNFLVNLEDYTYTYLGKSDGSVNRRIEQVLGNNNESVPGISMVEAGDIETEDLGWRVLSVNEDGSVNLIANRNKAQASTGTSFWLSSRCVLAGWDYANFRFRYMSGSGSISTGYVFISTTGFSSSCYGLRPVLQVSK